MPMSGMGGFGAAGALIFPISIVLLILRDKGPAGKFLKAGAVSPETARKPRMIGVTNLDLLDGPRKRKVLRPTGDGRVYVDRRMSRRWRVITAVLLGGFLTALAIGVLWFLRAYSDSL